MIMGISFNTRTETISQGRVFRLCRTKNKSGSICSVIYLVYLKHATGPTFLNLWTRIKWSPETRTENPHRGSGPNNKKGCIFHTVWHITSCFQRLPLPTPYPWFSKHRFDQAALSPETSLPLPKRAAAPHPEFLPPQQIYWGLECVFRKPLF